MHARLHRRLFHRDALLASGAIMGRLLRVKVPPHLTIHHARELLAESDAVGRPAEIVVELQNGAAVVAGNAVVSMVTGVRRSSTMYWA